MDILLAFVAAIICTMSWILLLACRSHLAGGLFFVSLILSGILFGYMVTKLWGD